MTLTHSRYNPKIRLLPDEMLEISQEISQKFTPNLTTRVTSPDYQRNPSPEEMFAISEEIRQRFAPKASDNTKEIVLLPVDPSHLYAYWNLDDDKLNTAQNNDSGNQLILRIYSESKKNADITKTKPWFDVVVESTQAQQKISLPSRTPETAYSATIGKRYPDNSLAPFASTNITHVPLGKVTPDQIKERQLVFEPTPQFIKPNREISTYTNNSASGQGNNQ